MKLALECMRGSRNLDRTCFGLIGCDAVQGPHCAGQLFAEIDQEL